jgi:hypothetical protein
MSQGTWSQGPQDGYRPSPRPPVRPAVTLPNPVAFEAVAGTPYGVAIVGVAPTTSGPATASLVTGIASIPVSLVVGCFGAVGAQNGWGPIVAGAFAVLAAFLGLAALLLGRAGVRQIRRGSGWSTVTGRGLAIAGMICGAVGLLLTVLLFVGSLALVGTSLVV